MVFFLLIVRLESWGAVNVILYPIAKRKLSGGIFTIFFGRDPLILFENLCKITALAEPALHSYRGDGKLGRAE